MKLKVPSSGNGYYGHEVVLSSPYMSDVSSTSSDDLSVDSPTLDGDFTEYMWMENEEEFEKQVMQQLEEEELMEQCLEAMLEDETELRNLVNLQNNTGDELSAQLQTLRVQDPQLATQSKLNPDAAEFVPQQRSS